MLILQFVFHLFARPSALTTFTDYQSLYWIYFNLFSNGPVWFLLFLEVFAAILPDIIIKVLENVRDTELIRKEKRDEQSRIERAKNSSKANMRLKSAEIGNIEGFHSSSNGLNSERDDVKPVLFESVLDKDIEKVKRELTKQHKVHNSAISPSSNSMGKSERRTRNSPSPKLLNNKIGSETSVKPEPNSDRQKGLVNRNFSVEEIK